MKKLAIIVCVVLIPYIAWNLWHILSLTFADGLSQRSLFLFGLLAAQLVILGLIGAGAGALVEAALKRSQPRNDEQDLEPSA